MSESVVVNKVKDRSKSIRRCGDHYEWGWVALNKRDRTKDYFNKVGEGTYEEGTQWMNGANHIRVRRRTYVVGR